MDCNLPVIIKHRSEQSKILKVLRENNQSRIAHPWINYTKGGKSIIYIALMPEISILNLVMKLYTVSKNKMGS